ncbi:unnamed protein product [Linum trigynum]|uniref:Uncharacterized protein n=1 Tax=Linum trigynum TaxID=586398 RepID=A0AAV2G534_9ROSI
MPPHINTTQPKKIINPPRNRTRDPSTLLLLPLYPTSAAAGEPKKPVLRHGKTEEFPKKDVKPSRWLGINGVTPIIANVFHHNNHLPQRHPETRPSLLISISSQLQMPNSTKWKRIHQLQGRPWRVEDSDVREVVLYRAGLVTAATSFVAAASTTFLPGDSSLLSSAIEQNLDVLNSVGAGRLGSRV